MDIVRCCKRVRGALTRRLGLKKLKVGHAGTLDPLATGVMIICTGRATKLIDNLQAGVKEYEASIALGATTPSFDLETEIDARYPVEHITEELVRDVLSRFTGRIEQIPPAFSACKVDGKTGLRTSPQRTRSRPETQSACNRQHRVAEFCPRQHKHTGSVFERHIYPCACP